MDEFQRIKKMEAQNAEFDACEKLSKQYKRLLQTMVVDDDYPEVRHDYERAVNRFLEACYFNGRTME